MPDKSMPIWGSNHGCLFPAGRETEGEEKEQGVKSGLVGLEGKHSKPAGLALRLINGQSETKAAGRRGRVVDRRKEIQTVKREEEWRSEQQVL